MSGYNLGKLAYINKHISFVKERTSHTTIISNQKIFFFRFVPQFNSNNPYIKWRSNIGKKRTESKPTKPRTKEVKTKKAEKGERYYCEVCGCEIVCIKPSEAAVVCCEEPMLLVLE